MSKIDKVKEFIGFLKAVFIVLIVIDSSLIAWLFKNPQLSIKGILVVTSILIVTIIDVIIFKNILKKLIYWRIYK